MPVGINIERGGAEISWTPGDYVGPVIIRARNMENGDVGVMKDSNDGKHFVTWPPGTWEDHILIYEDKGDEGTEQPEDVPRPDHTLPGDLPARDDEPHPDNTLPDGHSFGGLIDHGFITVTVAE